MDNPYASPSHVDYNPGRVSGSQFLLAIGLTLICAGLLAVALAVLFNIGLYFRFWAPLFAALILSWLLSWTIRVGHCRSRPLAAVIALIAALTMYIGQYHADMIWRFGPAAAYRFDLLPRYIAWRKTVEVDRRAARAGGQNQPNVRSNWLLFAFELAVVCGFTVVVGGSAATRPYCDRCQNWMRCDSDFLPAGVGPQLVQALEDDSLGDLLDLPSNGPGASRNPTVVTVAWCPPEEGGRSQCPAYLSIKSVGGKGTTLIHPLDPSFGQKHLYMRPLTERQIAELRLRFPEMSKAAMGTLAKT